MLREIALWEQGVWPIRMLDMLIGEALFDDSQLYAANTAKGREVLLKLVKREYLAIRKMKIAVRRPRVIELLGSCETEKVISEKLFEEKLLPCRTKEQAYEVTRKECARALREMKAEDARRSPAARNLFGIQQKRILKKALDGAESAITKEDFKGAAALYAQAIKASTYLAIVDGVDVEGKDRQKQRGLDLATEAARAITDATAEEMEEPSYQEDDEDEGSSGAAPVAATA